MNATTSHSTLEAINASLLNHNPFADPPFLKSHHVWGKSFPDIERLNAHASDAVFNALEQISKGQYSATSILITAEAGTGKTHIISRIRHRLQETGGAFFILANQYDPENLNNINAGFQRFLSNSLSNLGNQGVKQWQEVATSMTNFVLQKMKPGVQGFSAESLTQKLESFSEEKKQKWIKELSKIFCKNRPVKDPDVVKAIFWTLSKEQEPYASKWLAGKELAQYKANELLLPVQNKSFDVSLEVLDIIADYNEIVICFDELDDVKCNEAGLYTPQVVANLVKELIQNLKRGVVLTVMMPETWIKKVKGPMPNAISTKIATYGSPIDLKYMDGESILELVSRSLSSYYSTYNLVPPNPIYPFSEDTLRSLGEDRPTVRQVLRWCKDNCQTLDSSLKPPKAQTPVEDAFVSELTEAMQADLDNNQLIAEALYFGFQGLQGCAIDGVLINKVSDKVKNNKKKDSYLNFKISGKENGKHICIGVAILQHDGGSALATGFKRLLDQKNEFKLTRGCLIRSNEKPISSYLSKTYLQPFINEHGGEFVALKPEEIQPLLAIYGVWCKRSTDYGLTEEQISEFILQQGADKQLGVHNPLLLEILSDPSNEVPDLTEEPEAIAVDPDSENESAETTVLSDLLDENE